MCYGYLFPRREDPGTSDPAPMPRDSKKVKPVYALSGYAEYFWLLAKNWKPVENRSWSLWKRFRPSDIPVRVYIHASKTPASKSDINHIISRLNSEQLVEFMAVDWERYRGAIIGEMTITGQVTPDEIGMKAVHSVWFSGPFAFTVKDGELYPQPIPYRGMPGFFEVNTGGKI